MAGAQDVMDRVAAMDRALRPLEGLSVGDALWCAYHYMDDGPGPLWTAVSRVGDRDTLGAVVGGIVALGRGAIPAEWWQRREPLAAMLRLTGP